MNRKLVDRLALRNHRADSVAHLAESKLEILGLVVICLRENVGHRVVGMLLCNEQTV